MNEDLQSGSFRDELRTLLQLAWPVVLGQCGFTAMSIEDVVMVGRLGEIPLAALAAGNIWAFGTLILGIGLMVGIDPVFAQSHGAGEPKAAGRALLRAVVLCCVISVPIAVSQFLAEPALRFLGQPAEVIPVAAEYCQALSWSVLPALVFFALKQFLQGLGIMRPAAYVVVLANVINIGANAALIFGLGPAPELGAVGTGWATTIVRWCMPLVLVAMAWPPIRERLVPWREAFDLGAIARLVRIGGPVSIHIGVEVWAFNTIGILMGWLGARHLAAHSVALSTTTIAFMISFGLAAASATRVGNLVGAGLPWQRSGWIGVALSLVVMGTSSILLLTLPEPIAGIYTDDAAVIAVVVTLLPLAAAFQLFDGVQAVAAGVLRGAGDTRWPAVLAALGFWGFGLPVAYYLAFHRGWDEQGLWLGLVLSLAAVSFLLAGRVHWIGRRGGQRV